MSARVTHSNTLARSLTADFDQLERAKTSGGVVEPATARFVAGARCRLFLREDLPDTPSASASSIRRFGGPERVSGLRSAMATPATPAPAPKLSRRLLRRSLAPPLIP